MPILYSDIHTCEKCKKSFEWCYFKQHKHRNGTLPIVEDVPSKKIAYSCENNGEGGYNVSVNCPHCDYENRFISKIEQANE